jgi:hypothetical protein
MSGDKLIVDFRQLDDGRLNQACNDVIAALSKYPPEYKAGALHTLLASFPIPFEVIELERK